MVDSDYSLSLDSINSSTELESNKYKKVSFIKDNYYDDMISYFYDGLSTDIAFIINNNDDDIMSTNYYSQQDNLYRYGAKNIIDNKNYKEEYEYFAPLYISPNNLPKNFIIFRIDGNGIGNITKETFKSYILNNFKVVKIFDLSKNTNIGYWLDKNYNNNSFLPLAPFEMNFNNTEFSKWYGIDYINGGYIYKSKFLEDFYTRENEIFGFEKYVFDGYMSNGVVFPFILNISFLFDDVIKNDDGYKYYSINRYYGFYLDDMTLSKKVSIYLPNVLKDGTIIKENNILYNTGGDVFKDGYNTIYDNFIEYDGIYYNVVKIEEDGNKILKNVVNNDIITQEYMVQKLISYKIISDIDFKSQGITADRLNKNTIYIGDHNNITNIDGSIYIIDDWDTADIWLIEIDGIYHNIYKNQNEELIIKSDYTFKYDETNKFFYYWNDKNDKIKINTKIYNNRLIFSIYKLKFTDIKDFDNKIIDTDYSKYEYELDNELTNTDESKMYMHNLFSKSIPAPYDIFNYNNEYVSIPVASEYTANYETFKITNNKLTNLWSINPVYCRWGYQRSLSANDKPYLLNNSLLFEDFNRTVNIYNNIPERIDRNLDYFYSINASTSSYIHQTLNINGYTNSYIDTDYRFDIDAYTNSTFDYFTYFFSKPTYFKNGMIKKNTKKYSEFNKGNKDIPNTTLFRGIKFYIYDVQNDIKKDGDDINNFILTSNNTFDNYKFSIILTATQSDKKWTYLKEWQYGTKYLSGDIVLHDDILYYCNKNNLTENPSIQFRDLLSTTFSYYTYSITSSVLWNPNTKYKKNDIVYHNGEWYKCTTDMNSNVIDRYINTQLQMETMIDFYCSDIIYDYADVVLYEDGYYKSATISNTKSPDYKSPLSLTLKQVNHTDITLTDKLNRDINDYEYTNYWDKIDNITIDCYWDIIELYNKTVTYEYGDYSIYNNAVYKCISNGDITDTTKWNIVYSLTPMENYNYSQTSNPLIKTNGVYYLYTSTNESILDNGINIYINKKWKNILININFNDSLLPNLYNADRDVLYNMLYSNLTAFNFIQCINDFTNKHGFINYITYHIIDDDGTMLSINYNNISTYRLPYYIECGNLTAIDMNKGALKYVVNENPSTLKIYNNIDGQIYSNKSNIDYYNGDALSVDIIKDDNKITENKQTIYRYDGFYSPIFYDIELFKRDDGVNNYKFDTTLTDFALLKEYKIKKINHNGSVLKLRNMKDVKSIYPMVDEYIYTYKDLFIFKNSWDIKYNTMTLLYDFKTKNIDNITTANNMLSSYPTNIITDDVLDDMDIGIQEK